MQIDNAAGLQSVDSLLDRFFDHGLAEKTADRTDVTDKNARSPNSQPRLSRWDIKDSAFFG
jgi:hypothetical protein